MAAAEQLQCRCSFAALLSLLQLPIASILVQSKLLSRVATLHGQVSLRTVLKRQANLAITREQSIILQIHVHIKIQENMTRNL